MFYNGFNLIFIQIVFYIFFYAFCRKIVRKSNFYCIILVFSKRYIILRLLRRQIIKLSLKRHLTVVIFCSVYG